MMAQYAMQQVEERQNAGPSLDCRRLVETMTLLPLLLLLLLLLM